MLSGLALLLHEMMLFVSYVGSGSSFPKPMKPEEEQEALQAYHAGDQQAKNKLIERNLRLVAHIAKKYEGGNRSTEDMISIGTIGLIKAVNTYDGSKGTQLATYAARCIENAMCS
ncbi:flagellar biosynthesis protein FliA [Christensenellaceae bacterium NSJ-53]|uniref:Flagellar biosynthesis protein FliA n=1 Tax=Gehongia tenuis TaxID=2763655 RepID=A0A926D3M1_9FIRM|nr:sigma factor [Gehongia tenuis]MBC8531143.1 flagellar biosynthesis protein FliA [Gehongia tenuis]